MEKESVSRLSRLIGHDAVKRLESSRVVIFGLGGVGSYAAEAIGRSAVGYIDLVDADTVCRSNINRQLPALRSTIGLYKAEVVASRLRDINPEAEIRSIRLFFDDTTAGQFDFTQYDYIIDAIDSVSSKLLLIEMALKSGTPIISSMGAGNRLDPTAFKVMDVYKTSVCPLARVMRRELRKRGIATLKTVCSSETPAFAEISDGDDGTTKIGSAAFVTSAAGLLMAAEVIKDLFGTK